MNLLRRSFHFHLRLSTLNQPCIAQFPRLLTIVNTRTFILPRKQPKMEKIERKYQLKDKMPPTATLVYRNPSDFWIEPLSHVQNVFIIMGVAYVIYMIQFYLNNTIEFPMVKNNFIYARSLTEIVIFIIISGSILIASSLACRYSTLRIYYDKTEDVSKAVLTGIVPFTKKIINIKSKTATPVKRNYPVKNFRTFEYKANGRRLFMHDEYFRTPADLNRMLRDY